jgi:nicotinate-nucleotide adenylyltransferase
MREPMKKTGLLFGSFNPIHIGHMAIAGYIKEFAGMDEIWFIVSPQNPHKKPENLVSPVTRLHMVNLAIECHPAFKASDIEFDMPLPSYTVKTLQKLENEYPDRDFFMITGADNIESMRGWKHSRILLDNYKFLVYPRLNSDTSALSLFSKARIVNAPIIDISSSFIRESLREGREMRAFVPCKTYDYIEENLIYR